MPLRLIVFAKAPVAGQVKTRLIPRLGAQGAAQLARQLLMDTLTVAQAVVAALGDQAKLELCGSPEPGHAAWAAVTLPPGCQQTSQCDGDLGQRMAQAFDRAMAEGEDVLLFGTDGLGLDSARLLQAAQALHRHDAVLQPVLDGGYVLLGLRAHTRGAHAGLFEHMPWSTARVAALTLQRLQAQGWSTLVLPALRDLDEPADLAHRRFCTEG